MRTLAKKLCLLSLSGLEDIIDIPGTIGGGIIMNASAGLTKGLIYNSLDKVKAITPEGETQVVNGGSISFEVVPDEGYYVASFTVDGNDAMSGLVNGRIKTEKNVER